jgi:hypothetical protein
MTILNLIFDDIVNKLKNEITTVTSTDHCIHRVFYQRIPCFIGRKRFERWFATAATQNHTGSGKQGYAV